MLIIAISVTTALKLFVARYARSASNYSLRFFGKSTFRRFGLKLSGVFMRFYAYQLAIAFNVRSTSYLSASRALLLSPRFLFFSASKIIVVYVVVVSVAHNSRDAKQNQNRRKFNQAGAKLISA
jgi:hypothetical protein